MAWVEYHSYGSGLIQSLLLKYRSLCPKRVLGSQSSRLKPNPLSASEDKTHADQAFYFHFSGAGAERRKYRLPRRAAALGARQAILAKGQPHGEDSDFDPA
jgi:hypothetical protein